MIERMPAFLDELMGRVAKTWRRDKNTYPKSTKHPVKEVSKEYIANATQFSRQQFRHDGRVAEFKKLANLLMPRRIRRAIARDIVRRDYKWTHSTQVQEKVA